MKICYHGTNLKNASAIRKKGFRPETWFAKNLQDALSFGGLHLFEVVFDNPPDNWQFHTAIWISPDKIAKYMIYERQTEFENKTLQKLVFESNVLS